MQELNKEDLNLTKIPMVKMMLPSPKTTQVYRCYWGNAYYRRSQSKRISLSLMMTVGRAMRTVPLTRRTTAATRAPQTPRSVTKSIAMITAAKGTAKATSGKAPASNAMLIATRGTSPIRTPSCRRRNFSNFRRCLHLHVEATDLTLLLTTASLS
jgi:hypothetical protein